MSSCSSKIQGVLAILLGNAVVGRAQEERWIRGRATYYGGPSFLKEVYDPVRGEGSFGILPFGSCTYTESDGTLPFARGAVAAIADANVDWPGSCGRCYEVKCVDSLIYENPNKVSNISSGFFAGDLARIYLPSVSSVLKDEMGRAFPGNVAEPQGAQYTQCWDPSNSIRVRIVDSCPCKQVLPDGAPGVKPGGETRRQEWCCGGEQHFDLSFWGFQQLAHPVFGVMMLDFRPVDCNSGDPIPYKPGFVSSKLYSEVPQPGWSWFPYNAKDTKLRVQGYGPSGQGASCVTLSPQGGLSFQCRDCELPGYQPFKGKAALQLWIRPNSGSTDPEVSSAPLGEVPNLKMFLLNENTKIYCGAEPRLGSIKPKEKHGEWYRLKVSLDDFNCQGLGSELELITRVDIQNTAERDAPICIAGFELLP